MPQSKQIHQTSVSNVEIEYEHVVDDIHVYRWSIEKTLTSSSWKKDRVQQESKQGLLTKAQLQKLLREGKPAQNKSLNSFAATSPEDREAFLTKPFTDAAMRLYRGGFRGKEYESFVAGEWTKDDIVVVDMGSHGLSKPSGERLPLQQQVDYYSGLNTHDGVWHLDVMKSHLEQRDDVTFDNSRTNEVIQVIPYYNAEEDKSLYIGFYWHPSQEDFQKVYDHAYQGDDDRVIGSYEIQRAMFDLDILGLREAGALKEGMDRSDL